MSGRASRSYLAIASAILIAGVLISASTLTATGQTASGSAAPAETNPTGSSTSSATIITTHQTTFTFVLSPCNCSINLKDVWPTYSTLGDLSSKSELIVIANVTSARTVGANIGGLYGLGSEEFVPVTAYNVTIATVLSGYTILEPGTSLLVAQIGGTYRGATMGVDGYPSLAIGHSYAFFLSDPGTLGGGIGEIYWNSVASGLITTGGPQGLFYIQDGDVYSLNNTHPQFDSWLPVTADGVPLAQFASEVQAAAASSATTSSSGATTTTVTSSVTSSSSPTTSSIASSASTSAAASTSTGSMAALLPTALSGIALVAVILVTAYALGSSRRRANSI